MKMFTKSLLKKAALAVMLGGMIGMQTVWAGDTITITGNEETTPTIYSQTAGVGADGKGDTGNKSDLQSAVDKIQTGSGATASAISGVVYGIWSSGAILFLPLLFPVVLMFYRTIVRLMAFV